MRGVQAAGTVVGTDLFLSRAGSVHTLGEWRTVWRQPGFPLPHRQYANSAEFQKPGADRLFAEPGTEVVYLDRDQTRPCRNIS